jgi:hypothetical protein
MDNTQIIKSKKNRSPKQIEAFEKMLIKRKNQIELINKKKIDDKEAKKALKNENKNKNKNKIDINIA